MSPDERLLERVSWILPDRPLHQEIARVLEQGYVRAAEGLHLAVALYLAGDAPGGDAFLSLDQAQRRVAQSLGFSIADNG